MPATLIGLVLAAGRSSRMGQPKAVLPDGEGEPFVARVVRTLGEAGLARVFVVAAPDTRDAIETALREQRDPPVVTVLVNPEPDHGQLSSLLTGLAAAGDADSLLVTLVDVPFVSAETVAAVIAAWKRTRAPIVRPASSAISASMRSISASPIACSSSGSRSRDVWTRMRRR